MTFFFVLGVFPIAAVGTKLAYDIELQCEPSLLKNSIYLKLTTPL